MPDIDDLRNLRGNAPWQALGDIYTVCGNSFAGADARSRSVYNLTMRRSPAVAWPGVARDSRIVLFGMTHFVRECLLDSDLWGVDTNRVDAFMGNRHSFGGPLGFDRDLFKRASRQFDGNLPIRIEALPDGSTVYPNEPVVQVTSLGDGFGEFAALVEAALLGMVACASARATVSRHLLYRMYDEVRSSLPNLSAEAAWKKARSLVHDFGMRASSTPLEAEIFGQAHLLSFDGSDTTSASYKAWMGSPSKLEGVGTSILAHAHRIILGHETEADAVRALADAVEATGFPIGSFLCDTFDTRSFVEKLAIPLALEYKRRGRGVVVVRPDSGDYLDNVSYLVGVARQAGLVAFDEHLNTRPRHLGILMGDSMNPEKILKVWGLLRQLGCNRVDWATFGIGGWLRAQGNRDILSSAYKLAAKGPDDTPVVKLSEVREKMSVPGPSVVTRGDGPRHPSVFMDGEGIPRGRRKAYRAFYDGLLPGDDAIGEVCFEGFDAWRGRLGSELTPFAPDAPTGVECLSPGTARIRDEAFRRWRGDVSH